MKALAGHYHDTYGMAVANVYASYQFGLRAFDSAVAGLGGCPYAKGATGNVATGDGLLPSKGTGCDTASISARSWMSPPGVETVLGRASG